MLGAASSHAASGTTAAPPTRDGESLFRGVFFGEGEIARSLHGTSWATPRSLAVGDQVLASIRTASPQFFPSFLAEMTSGDRLRISAALADGKQQLSSAAASLGGAATTRAAGSIVITGSGIFVGTGTFWAPAEDDGRLGEERLVDHIAEELRS
ncbi:hypothetical protein ACQPZZ_31010 [Microbispora sp. CA-135349]|uniref:hypothetical protein n=1 Tax=Microbispora sp. CA-135349 TaxID=3239953 RepID=UPI003D8C31F1